MFTQLEVDAADHDASASGVSIDPHHFNELIIVKEKKPFEGDQPIKSEAYCAVNTIMDPTKPTDPKKPNVRVSGLHSSFLFCLSQ